MTKIFYKVSKNKITFPDETEYGELNRGFKQLADMEGCILTLDGTQIPIIRPSECPFDFFERKGTFSLKLICVVDHKMRFKGVTYGFGASHDSRVLRISNLYKLIRERVPERYFILGDGAFSGFERIKITESTRSHPISIEESIKLIRQRIIVENAFGLFKNKFKRFDVRSYGGQRIKNIKILLSSLWVHNFIIDNN